MKERDTFRDALALREIQAALKASKQERAEELAARAIADGVLDPLPFYVRAHGLMRHGRQQLAVRDLQQAVALAPRNVSMRNTVGALLISWQMVREAIPILQEAVRLEPRSALGHFNLAWAYERAGELALCRSSYANALELDPRHATALARLAGVAFRQGDLEAAKDYATRSLAISPGTYNALAALANVALQERDLDRADEYIQKVLKLDPLPPIDRASALGMLGDLRHAQGRYGEAFHAYTSGNREKQQLYAPQFARPNMRSFGQFAATLVDYFEAARSDDWSASGAQDSRTEAQPVFVVGFARSGTTLLESILSTHPALATLAERQTLNEAMVRLFTDEAGIERLRTLSPEDAEQMRASYWKCVRDCGVEITERCVVDVNPFYSLSLPVVGKVFPNAKVIFALRDPRDVVLSCFRTRIGVNPVIYELLTLEGAARLYNNTMKLRTLYLEKLGLDWFDLRHESLVEDFDGEAARICAFLGVPYAPEMRDFANRAKDRAITTASAAQISRGLNKKGFGQWRRYAKELAPVLPLIEPWVARFGYEPSQSQDQVTTLRE